MLHSEASEDFGSDDVESIDMVDNYRSRADVVRFNNGMIGAVMNLENNSLNSEIDDAYKSGAISKDCYDELRDVVVRAYSSYEQTPCKKSGEELGWGGWSDGFAEVVTYEGDDDPTIATICGAIDRGYKPSDIMVLTRSKSQATTIAQKILEIKSSTQVEEYRFDVVTQEALVIGNAAVSNFVAAVMRLSLNPKDRLQRAFYNQFLKRDSHYVALSDRELTFLRRLRMYSLIEAFEMIVMEYELDAAPESVAYLQAIHEQVISFSNSKLGDMKLFLEWWDDKGSKRYLSVERGDSAIEILTIHKSKGLEKKVIIIPQCNWARGPVANDIVWSQERGDDGGQLYPLSYKGEMGNSSFAEEYYRSNVYAHMDSLNLFYVALTRAVESLHIFVKVNQTQKSRNAKGIGSLVLGAIPDMAMQPQRLESTDAEGQKRESFQWGSSTRPEVKKKSADNPNVYQEVASDSYIERRYKSTPMQVKLHLPTKRYRMDEQVDGVNGGESLTPREIGILMHKVFEIASSREDIFKVAQERLANGLINGDEHLQLMEALRRSLEDSRAAEWFDTEWDMVRNESDIVVPESVGSASRPDRVMIRGSRAVVVDYKFGEPRPGSNTKQMREYMSLLGQMGYSEVEGYIWYIRYNKIESVV